MKQIYGLAALLTGMILTTANAQIKLWPQITPGIYNHANVLAMKCEVAEDGLTVTDAAWDTYKVAGCGKRWTLNMGAPMDVPLKNYKFGPRIFRAAGQPHRRVLQSGQAVGSEGELPGNPSAGRQAKHRAAGMVPHADQSPGLRLRRRRLVSLRLDTAARQVCPVAGSRQGASAGPQGRVPDVRLWVYPCLAHCDDPRRLERHS